MKARKFQRPKRGIETLTLLVAWLLSVTTAFAAAETFKVALVLPHRVFFSVAGPVYIAEEKGFYKEAGLQVDTTFTKGGGENVQAVVAGDANIGLSTGFFAVLSAFAKGAPIKVASSEIAGMPDVYWYVLGSSPVQKMEELAGKKVAYSLAGSSSHMAVLALVDQLKAKGLKPPEPISLGGLPDTFTGVKTGQAEAGWAAPPFFLDRVEKGEIRIAFRGSELAALRDLTIRVNFVNADFAKKNPEVVRRFFRAHQKALDFMLDRREETAKIWMRRAELKLPEAIVMKTWDFYPRSAMALKPIKGIQTAVDDAVKFNFLKQPLSKSDLDRLIDLSFLP